MDRRVNERRLNFIPKISQGIKKQYPSRNTGYCCSYIKCTDTKYNVLNQMYRLILAHRIRISEFYPGIENLILPMLSYPGRQVTLLCEIAS